MMSKMCRENIMKFRSRQVYTKVEITVYKETDFWRRPTNDGRNNNSVVVVVVVDERLGTWVERTRNKRRASG